MAMKDDMANATRKAAMELEKESPAPIDGKGKRCVCPECAYEGDAKEFEIESTDEAEPVEGVAIEVKAEPVNEDVASADMQDAGTPQPAPKRMNAREAARKAMEE